MEAIIRLSAFGAVFFVMTLWEALRPRRLDPQARRIRWPINLGLAGLNSALLRLIAGGALYQTAVWAEAERFGLLHWLGISGWPAMLLSFLLLDFAIYLQHIVSHKWPLLWRLHQVHHTDLVFDATTAIRFHPLEILLSMAYKIVIALLAGAEALTTIAFEILLNGSAIFNHSNVDIPERLDRKLRLFLITPDMHRIHHSTDREETDTNYGFSLSCWDRLCGTYRAQPRGGQLGMAIGLKPFRETSQLGFLRLLRIPFEQLRTWI